MTYCLDGSSCDGWPKLLPSGAIRGPSNKSTICPCHRQQLQTVVQVTAEAVSHVSLTRLGYHTWSGLVASAAEQYASELGYTKGMVL